MPDPHPIPVSPRPPRPDLDDLIYSGTGAPPVSNR